MPKLLPRKTVQVVAGPPVDLSEFAGQPLTNQVLRAATDKIMTDVAALLGGLRGLTPPAEFYHPAVARRKMRQDLRELAEQPGRARRRFGTRQQPREGSSTGRRRLGHHVRPGAVRRRNTGDAVVPPARAGRAQISTRHESPRYLPGIALPASLHATADPAEALAGAEIVVLAVPAADPAAEPHRLARAAAARRRCSSA